MNNYVYLRGFDSFSKSNSYQVSLNEMASSLMEIPEFKKQPELMQFIHTLTGKKEDRSWSKKGMRRGGKFRTDLGTYYGGDWPEHQDFRLSHDVMVKGKKTGKDRIYNWLDSLDKKKDTNPNSILINPDPVAPTIWYLTKKTGTLSPAERQQMFGDDDKRLAWEKGISVKAGYFMRAITIDQETGQPLSTWLGTLGQLMDNVNDDAVLYIMEDDKRAQDKYNKRIEEQRMDKDKFVEFFTDNYMPKLEKAMAKKQASRRDQFSKMAASMKPEDIPAGKYSDFSSAMKELAAAAREISSGEISNMDLGVQYDRFVEYLMEEGDYKASEGSFGDSKADIKDVIDRHSMMGACSKFLQFIVTGKTSGVYVNVLADIGLGDAADLSDAGDIDLGDLGDLGDL